MKFALVLLVAGLTAGAWYFHSSSTGTGPRLMDEEQNLEKAKAMALGISRAELIEGLGQPIQSYHSKDGRYELLRFPTPPTSPDLVAATVERSTGKVVSYKPGASGHRSSAGFDPQAVHWDFSVNNPK